MQGHGLSYSIMPSTGIKRRTQESKRRSKKTTANRKSWFDINGPCKHCGSWDNLELDHIVPVKVKHNNSRIWIRSKSYRTKELQLCQPLCRTCHRKKNGTETRKHNHGLNLYERHGCRCSVCRSANAAKKRLARARRKVLKTTQNFLQKPQKPPPCKAGAY